MCSSDLDCEIYLLIKSELKSFCTAKESNKNEKATYQMGENTRKPYTTGKESVSKIKNSHTSISKNNNKKQTKEHKQPNSENGKRL